MNGHERYPAPARHPEGEERETHGPARLVPFQGEVPERLAGFFGRLNPWTWRDLRTVFCRFPETRRLANILRTIDLVLEKAPHTLARGHWSISGYRDARRNLESAIARLGHLANQVAADARVRLPVVPERTSHVSMRRPKAQTRSPGRPVPPFRKLPGNMTKGLVTNTEAA